MKNTLKQSWLDSARDISSDNLMRHVLALTEAEMRGRMPGDSGYDLACQYVETCLKSYGLTPPWPDNFRQEFTLETNRIVTCAGIYHSDTGPRKWELGTDYICRGLTSGGNIRAPLVFIGYGLQDDTLDELAAVPLAGRIAVAFKYPPKLFPNPHDFLPRSRAHRLIKQGAKGLILVPNPLREAPDRLSASLMESGSFLPDFPMIVLSQEAADELMNFDDQTLSSRQYKIDEHRASASCEIPGEAEIKITVDHNPEGLSWNVLGILKGEDQSLAKEALLIGSHLDHVGIQGEAVTFPGAQDDASGVAAMLEIAREMANQRPARSVIFAAFCAEESGLKGSKYYVANPIWPLADTRFMLNLDCMAAGDGLDTRGRKDFPGLFEIADYWNREFIGIPDTMALHGAGGADAEPFHQAGIPNMFWVSRNPYAHLHMCSDMPATLNPILFESITRLIYLTAATLLDGHEKEAI